jgi:hypothetical protein
MEVEQVGGRCGSLIEAPTRRSSRIGRTRGKERSQQDLLSSRRPGDLFRPATGSIALGGLAAAAEAGGLHQSSATYSG